MIFVQFNYFCLCTTLEHSSCIVNVLYSCTRLLLLCFNIKFAQCIF
ncbi:unnamed protein product [Tenebrio molitor]|nr:unnamed protein product [Tenebrio molitor]